MDLETAIEEIHTIYAEIKGEASFRGYKHL